MSFLCIADYGKWYWASLKSVKVSTGFIEEKKTEKLREIQKLCVCRTLNRTVLDENKVLMLDQLYNPTSHAGYE